MINLNSMVNAPEFSSPDAMPRKIDALTVENRELKIAREISEKDWIDILAGLSLGDVNDRPRFVAYDESYCLSRRDCAKMAQQLVRHFAPRTAPNTSDQRAGGPAIGMGPF